MRDSDFKSARDMATHPAGKDGTVSIVSVYGPTFDTMPFSAAVYQ